MLAKVAERDLVQLVVAEHRRGRLRGEHLPAMAGGHDPRRPMDADAVIATLVGKNRLCGMHPHPNPELPVIGPRVGGKRALPLGRGRGRVASTREDIEEGVALGVYLFAAMRGERLAQQTLMLLQDRPVAAPKLPQQPR